MRLVAELHLGRLAIALALALFCHSLSAADNPPGIVPNRLTAVNNTNHPLRWDALVKQYSPKAHETTNQFVFTVTNTAGLEVTIKEVNPSCGCTVATLPANPWVLKPGEKGDLRVTMDFAGKFGNIQKSLAVVSSAGPQVLTIVVDVPITEESKRRQANMEMARGDKQAVLRGDCAKCHVAPAVGKTGEELYVAACGICHDAQNRASEVPNLRDLGKKTYLAYWKYWLMNGGPFMMPSFAKEKGGFLSEEEITALAEFLDKKFPSPTVIRPMSAK